MSASKGEESASGSVHRFIEADCRTGSQGCGGAGGS